MPGPSTERFTLAAAGPRVCIRRLAISQQPLPAVTPSGRLPAARRPLFTRSPPPPPTRLFMTRFF